MADDSVQTPPTTPLPSCPERSVRLSLPVPINARLDQLVRLAEQAGERTSRKEIVAVCILGAPDGADEMVRWLRICRKSTADSTATSGANLNDLLELRPTPPGPRPRHWRHRPPTTPRSEHSPSRFQQKTTGSPRMPAKPARSPASVAAIGSRGYQREAARRPSCGPSHRGKHGWLGSSR